MGEDEIRYRLSQITMAHERALNEIIREWANAKVASQGIGFGLGTEARQMEEVQEAITALVAQNGYQ